MGTQLIVGEFGGMMKTQFTSGPWVAIAPKERSLYDGSDITSYCVMSEKTRGELRDAGFSHYRKDDSYVDNVDITGMVFVRDLSLEEARANANLIAAAPEMYEALDGVEFYIEEYLRSAIETNERINERDGCTGEGSHVRNIRESLAALRNAMKKARGEPEQNQQVTNLNSEKLVVFEGDEI